MTACVYCGEDKGKRECPALGGLISASCCGENRGVRITCPPDCRHYVKNERYQRERLAPAFHEAWLQRTVPFYQDERTAALDFVVFLEGALYNFFRRETRATDEDIVDALGHVKRKLSPIQIIEAPGTRLGQHLWQAVEGYQQRTQGVGEDDGQAATDALVEAIGALGDEDSPREGLHGLLGHVEQYIGVPEDDPSSLADSDVQASRIFRPDA